MCVERESDRTDVDERLLRGKENICRVLADVFFVYSLPGVLTITVQGYSIIERAQKCRGSVD